MYLEPSLRKSLIKDIGEEGKGQRGAQDKFGGMGQWETHTELKVKGSEVQK